MKSSLAKNGMAVFGANLLASFFSLLRNILLARLLGPENYGVGAVFVLVLTFLDMASSLSLDRQIVQSKKGYDKKFIDNVHFAEFIKGLALAILMYLGAPFYSDLLGVKDIQWAFELLSIVPLVRGVRNWGIAVEQKDSRFKSTVFVEVIPQLLSLIAIWPLCFFIDDYKIFIYITFIQTTVLVVISHLATKTSYGLRFDREFSKSIISFGWPLLLNGLLMYLFLQGDRVLVSRYYGLEMLGYFSAAFSLSIMPVMIIGKVFNTLFLPLLSSGGRSAQVYTDLLVYSCGIVSLLYAAFLYAAGTYLYLIIYGDEFFEGAYLLSLIGYAHALRIMRVAPAVIATSCASTKSILYSNLIRGVGFIIAIVIAMQGGEITWIIVSAALGELLALIYQTFFVKYSGLYIFAGLQGFIRYFAFMGLASLLCMFLMQPVTGVWAAAYTVCVLFLILCGFLYFYVKKMSDLYHDKSC